MGNKQSNSHRRQTTARKTRNPNDDEKLLNRDENIDQEFDKNKDSKEAPVKSEEVLNFVNEHRPSDISAKVSSQEVFVPSSPPPEPVSYHLKLYCIKDPKKSRNVTVIIEKPPRTVLDIKMYIQKELSIPACCFSISFESCHLRDHYLLEELRIRDGDTLTIHYTAEALVEEVTDIISSIRHMECFLTSELIEAQLWYGHIDPELDADIYRNLNAFKVESLATTYFHPSKDPTCQANRLFFVKNGGLEEMHRLHTVLLKYPWSECHIEMQLVEHAILRVLWNISAAFSLRMLLFERPTMEAVMKSLVRVKIPADRKIQGPARNFESTRVTCEMLYKAVGTICNLADIPECRLQIASRKDILDQLLATLTCPSYNYIASLVAGAGLLCLSYSPETHQYLITDNVIQKMDKACNSYKYQTPMDEQLLKYFRSMFYAELLFGSGPKIPLALKHKMHSAIKEFLESADYKQIREHEKSNGYIWSTVEPIVKLAYFPYNNPSRTLCTYRFSEDTNKEMRELEDLCVEAGAFSLQNMMLCDTIRELLIAEHLLDFVVCLPWHLDKNTKAYKRACELNTFLAEKMQMEPPSLVNMAKAKLAATHFGLEKVTTLSVHELALEIM